MKLLRYGPVEGAYRIALTHSDGDARFITRPWANCDRSEKLTSFPAIPRLLMAVAKAVVGSIGASYRNLGDVECAVKLQDANADAGNRKRAIVLVMNEKATIIASDPTTGEILGMANYPSFNLNEYRTAPMANQRNYRRKSG